MGQKTPLWETVANTLRDEINKNTYKVGTLLPGDFELADRFNVSRITVRKALDVLTQEQLITRQRGIGTIVQAKKEALQTTLHASTDLIVEHDTSSRVLEEVVCIDIEDAAILTYFNCESSTKMLRVTRKSRSEKGRIATFITHINPIVLLEDVDDFSGSLYDLLTQKGFSITRFNETISARISTHEDEAQFELKSPTAMIIRTRQGFSKDLPVEYTQAIYNSDRYTIVVDTVQNEKEF